MPKLYEYFGLIVLFYSKQASQLTKEHPSDPLILPEGVVIEITKAEYVEGYKLKLKFSDNIERIVDFEPFLKLSTNPLIRKYLAFDQFKRFKLEYGDLQWNDYDLCFPIADLYEGRIA